VESSIENTKRRTLWVVTELYYPEMTSTGYYLTKIAEGLAKKFNVKALCGQPNYSVRGTRAEKRQVHAEVEIFRSFGTTLDKNIIPFRVINMLTLSISIFFKAIRYFEKGDQVLVVTTPPSLPFISAVAALFRGCSYVLLIHDNYPEILIAAGKTKADSMLVRFMSFWNRWLYKYASKIIVVGRDMKELVARKTEGLDIPIEIIPNWAELEQVEPQPRDSNLLLKELGISDKLVFLYAGNMGYPNDIESIVWCANELRSDDRFQFVFLGAGVKKKWLEAEVDEKQLKNVTILEPRPRNEQIDFLNACDIGIVSLVPQMWGVSMPSRTYNILAAGKPILALTETDSELFKVVKEEHVGWNVLPGQKEDLLEMILKIYDEKSCLPEKSRNSRAAALDKYSVESAIDDYLKVLL
jgi:glycosyltransferase involved in cell wall biosynthesis